jgi:uncharacterized protein (DUF58 family)
VRPRKRAAGLLAGALVLFAIGTNVQAGWLYVLAALLLGALVAGLVLPVGGLRGLGATLHVAEEAEQGTEAFVEIRLTNASRGVRWAIEVLDDHLEPVDVFVGSIRPRERVDVTTVRMPARRGRARTANVDVRTRAPFGVAEHRRRLVLDPPAETLVLPRVVPLGPLGFVEAVRTTEPAAHPWPRRGTGPDYLGVREYRPGDSMRHVHWALTARHGQVMVREFEEERTRRLAIVVDTWRDADGSPTPLDRCCSVAASVFDAAAAHGSGARLVAGLPGGDVDVLHRAEVRAALRWLALLEPGGPRLLDVLEHLGPDDLRGVGSALVVAPAWPELDDDELATSLTSLARRSVSVTCVLVEVPGAAGALARTAAALSAAGVDVRPWRDEELGAALAAGPREAVKT